MYIDNENFEKWMEKLSKKLTEIGQDLKSLINTDTGKSKQGHFGTSHF